MRAGKAFLRVFSTGLLDSSASFILTRCSPSLLITSIDSVLPQTEPSVASIPSTYAFFSVSIFSKAGTNILVPALSFFATLIFMADFRLFDPVADAGGVTGIQGTQGSTGIQGLGTQGVTGLALGSTGIQGLGTQGVTGLALGSTGIQGSTGLGGSGGSGSLNVIRFAVGTDATTDSSTSLPASARVMYAHFEVTTPYDGGTTISVGRAGAISEYITTAGIDTQTAGINAAFQDTDGGSSAIRVTINTSPAAGAGVCVVWYTNPSS